MTGAYIVMIEEREYAEIILMKNVKSGVAQYVNTKKNKGIIKGSRYLVVFVKVKLTDPS